MRAWIRWIICRSAWVRDPISAQPESARVSTSRSIASTIWVAFKSAEADLLTSWGDNRLALADLFPSPALDNDDFLIQGVAQQNRQIFLSTRPASWVA